MSPIAFPPQDVARGNPVSCFAVAGSAESAHDCEFEWQEAQAASVGNDHCPTSSVVDFLGSLSASQAARVDGKASPGSSDIRRGFAARADAEH